MSHGLKKLIPKKKRWWAVIIIAAVAIVSLVAHREDEQEFADIDYDPETTPTMYTEDATSYVSDSGYVRYYIEAKQWYIYDEAKEPNWKFPDGIYGEKFDNDMKVISTFECDSAIYLSIPKLWELVGNVRINNEMGDKFLTQHLFWNTSEHKMYSDSFIHIEKSDRIVEGYGFVSDERITEYEVYRPSMIIPASELNRDRTQEGDTAMVVPDTLSTGVVSRRPPRPREGYPVVTTDVPHVLPGGHVEGRNNPRPSPTPAPAHQESPQQLRPQKAGDVRDPQTVSGRVEKATPTRK